jgi:transcriptional antiterminator RfaH
LTFLHPPNHKGFTPDEYFEEIGKIDNNVSFMKKGEIEWTWRALNTRPRAEKKVADILEASGYEVFCPLITTIRQWSDRKKKVQVPMISRYVFVRVNSLNANSVFISPNVISFVRYNKRPAIIRDEEIEAMQKAIQMGVVEVKVESWAPGSATVISSGPFAGKEAVIEQKDRHYLYVHLVETGLRIQFRIETIPQTSGSTMPKSNRK